MDFVDEERLPRLEIGDDGHEVAHLLQGRPRGLAEARIHLVGDDVGQGGLAEAGRTEEEDVIERLAALACRLDGDLQVRFDLLLADVLVELSRTKRKL